MLQFSFQRVFVCLAGLFWGGINCVLMLWRKFSYGGMNIHSHSRLYLLHQQHCQGDHLISTSNVTLALFSPKWQVFSPLYHEPEFSFSEALFHVNYTLLTPKAGVYLPHLLFLFVHSWLSTSHRYRWFVSYLVITAAMWLIEASFHLVDFVYYKPLRKSSLHALKIACCFPLIFAPLKLTVVQKPHMDEPI